LIGAQKIDAFGSHEDKLPCKKAERGEIGKKFQYGTKCSDYSFLGGGQVVGALAVKKLARELIKTCAKLHEGVLPFLRRADHQKGKVIP
jgi:hypothetical protein